MTTDCPNGHDSEWADWCSICGEQLGATSSSSASAPSATSAAASAPSPAPDSAGLAASSGRSCTNCGEPRHDLDVFCESCGYDFASGSLPEGQAAADAASASAAGVPPMHARVTVDATFFAASAGDVELILPDPLPDARIVPLPGIRILIGRKSTSRGIFPEIDVRALTDDPAVSSRHAMLERTPTGAWTLTDLGSTNGTFLTADADDSIEAGVALPVTTGATIFIGAWTRIELAETTT